MKMKLDVVDKQDWFSKIAKHLQDSYKVDCNHEWELKNQSMKAMMVRGVLVCKKCGTYVEYRFRNNFLRIYQIVHKSGYIIHKENDFLKYFVNPITIVLLGAVIVFILRRVLN